MYVQIQIGANQHDQHELTITGISVHYGNRRHRLHRHAGRITVTDPHFSQGVSSHVIYFHRFLDIF